MNVTIDYHKLKAVCQRPIKDFAGCGKVTNTRDGIYIYRPNKKSKILGVAHLDTVLGSNHFFNLRIGQDDIVINPCLDDRLGAYTLLSTLPALGIEFDLLLTEGEEQGRSTAYHFQSEKSYNWIFSFDRRGDDVVMYQYDDLDIREALKSVGFRPSIGTFSDIAFLDQLGVKGINIGTGYEGEHTNMSYANMTTWKSQVIKFKRFYDKYKDTKFTYEDLGYGWVRTPQSKNSTHYDRYADWGDYNARFYKVMKPYTKESSSLGECDFCQDNSATEEIDGLLLCNTCMSQMAKCTVCQQLYFDDQLMDGICQRCLDRMNER